MEAQPKQDVLTARFVVGNQLEINVRKVHQIGGYFLSKKNKKLF
jgi:hypothetical protein